MSMFGYDPRTHYRSLLQRNARYCERAFPTIVLFCFVMHVSPHYQQIYISEDVALLNACKRRRPRAFPFCSRPPARFRHVFQLPEYNCYIGNNDIYEMQL